MADQLAAIYEDLHGLLMWVCAVKFRLPTDEAEAAIHEVMLSLMQTGVRIDDVRSWLVAAACNACRHYWRRRANHELREPVVEDIAALLDESDLAATLERRFLVAQVLGLLATQQRLALRLHYFEGCTAREVAMRMGITVGYAEKLIHKSLKRARQILEEISGTSGDARRELSSLAAAPQRGDRST